jgi:hypothetical protein
MPYREEDARAYISRVSAQRPETAFAIALNSMAVGSISFRIG